VETLAPGIIKEEELMTRDEAIKILTIHNDHNPDFTDAQRREAHQLGIEALVFIEQHRSVLHTIYSTLLPGETKEEE